MKDQDAAHEEEMKFFEENDEEKTKDAPPPRPATRVEWRELPSGIGALKTVELIGVDTRRFDTCVCASVLRFSKFLWILLQLCRGPVREGWRL